MTAEPTRRQSCTRDGAQGGFSFAELLVALALIGIALVAAVVYVRPAASTLHASGAELASYLRYARASAIATTSSFRVRPSAPDRVLAEYADNCAAASWTTDDEMPLAFAGDVTLTDTSWSVCFSGRGVADAARTLTLTHPDLGSTDVEVLLGGVARVVP